MADFGKALKKILKWEGGWSNNIHDAGGATMKGITLHTYRSVYGNRKTKEDLKCIKDNEVEHIYRKFYWDVMKGDYIHNQSLAELIFDFVVNSGISKIKDCQSVTKVLPDGTVGEETLKQWNSYPSDSFNAIWNLRKRYYENVAQKGDNKVFSKGWMNRLNSYKFSNL